MADRRPMLRRRDGDRLGSLISHARPGLALAIPSLTMAVSLFPALIPLVPAVCRAPLVATDRLAARWAAVSLPTIATRTDREYRAAGATDYQSENGLSLWNRLAHFGI